MKQKMEAVKTVLTPDQRAPAYEFTARQLLMILSDLVGWS